jgi:drug/metabolite transporter (DMT)-like permease
MNKYLTSELINFNFISLTLLAGFLCSLGTICLIKAVNIGELSVLGPINSYKSVIGLITAMFFLKEIPSFYAILGMFLIILGSKFIFNSKDFSLDLFKRKDIQLRFLALFLTGIEAVILKKIILISSVEVCFIFWCFMGLLWSLFFVVTSKRNIKLENKNILIYLILIAIMLGLMQYSTNYVFKRVNVGYSLALFQLSSIVTVLLGCKFFDEKSLYKKLLGSFIMILGSCLIILL